MLAEGNRIRSIERITGVHRDTIMRLGIRIPEPHALSLFGICTGLFCWLLKQPRSAC